MITSFLMAMAASASSANDNSRNNLEVESERATSERSVNYETDQSGAEFLIHRGLAYAQAGLLDQAKEMFRAAMVSPDRVTLETADGKWRDSRHLAKLALEMLENGDLTAQ